jgi:hypothetical protein
MIGSSGHRRFAGGGLPASLNVVSDGALETVSAAMRRAANTFVVSSLAGLRSVLEFQLARPCAAALSLDLIGHSTRDHQLLRLGATTIDALDLGVLRFFEGLGRSGILRELNIACLRLLGCETAMTPSGQRTLRLLASALRVPVHGSRKRLSRMHHTTLGFDPRFQHLLIGMVHTTGRDS